MPPLSVRYSTTPTATDATTFAVVRYGAASSDVTVSDGHLHIDVAMPVLGHTHGCHEVWNTTLPRQASQAGPVAFMRNEELLFGALCLDDGQTLEQVSRDGYQTLLDLLRDQGYPYPLRTWNYLPHIVDHEAGMERYQLFCSGRHAAFNTAPGYENLLPAASALGTHAPGFLIYFIAARNPGIQVENPQQVSAFRYPRQYGPKPPSFSRALVKPWCTQTNFYLSGTASVFGHASLYPGDIGAQLRLTLDNIECLIARGRVLHPASPARLDELQLLKVYLRNAEDYPQVRAELQQRLGEHHPVLYLLADVCRTELLVEIEGMAFS